MSYTSGSLLGYMETEIGPLLAQLSLDTSDALAEGVAEIAALLDEAIADVDDDLKLRTLARWQAWTAALNAATNQYDVSLTGGKKFVRSQMFDQIARRQAAAEAEASRYSEVQAVLAGAGGTAYVTSVSTSGSPYGWPASDEWS